jgi:2-polyprenyl-6-methoxyphenol hydroxylase-like FAD-dependent oxidoreductase
MTASVGSKVSYDVVVIGAGIAGSALATVLAREGYEVLVLERQTSYRDKVRGETILQWGVNEMLHLDLEEAFLEAGGCYESQGVLYDEVRSPAEAEANAAPFDQILPGIPGFLDLGHPQACEALSHVASAAGATLVKGIGDITIETGATPHVRYEYNDLEYDVRTRLVGGGRRPDLDGSETTRDHASRDHAPNYGRRNAHRWPQQLARRQSRPWHRRRLALPDVSP